ncbi:MAG: UDP-N-acetylenolpyruvoylglucosamine reductase, partial [Bacteroidetes bacterium HGW-Bacteroidetes-22]
MQIIYNKSLRSYNTFGFEAKARAFVLANSEQDVLDAVAKSHELSLPLQVLGGGSNVLIRKDQDSMILKMEIGGIVSRELSSGDVLVSAGGGCDWELLVDYAVENQLWGIENLTLIPGKVGSSPIQNIGAYGVELKDVFYSLKALDMQTGRFVEINADECRFG